MIYCQDCVNLLGDYVDGELSKEEQENLEEHLSWCPPCVTFLRTYRATSKVARTHMAASMPEELSTRLHEFLTTQIKKDKETQEG